MRILILCKRYYTNKDLLKDQFGRLFHLPVELSRRGAAVTVVALDYRSSIDESVRYEDVAFRTVPATMGRIASLYSRVQEQAHRFKPEVIVASGDSHIGYAGSRLASEMKSSFVFDVYDYYPAFAGNRLPGMRTMFRVALRKADLTLSASLPLLRKLTQASKKVILIENGVDLRLFAPRDIRTAKQVLGVTPQTPLIGYFGSITPFRGPLLFDAIKIVKTKVPDATLLLSGKITKVSVPDNSAIYKGEVPQSEIPGLISACDVATIPYARSAFNDMAGPCKIAEYLACGVPVVATRVSGHESFFSDAPESLCDPEPNDVARAIVRQLSLRRVAKFPTRLEWSSIGLHLFEELMNLRATATEGTVAAVNSDGRRDEPW